MIETLDDLGVKSYYTDKLRKWETSWSSGNAFASGAGGLKFKSQAGQIERRVANG